MLVSVLVPLLVLLALVLPVLILVLHPRLQSPPSPSQTLLPSRLSHRRLLPCLRDFLVLVFLLLNPLSLSLSPSLPHL